MSQAWGFYCPQCNAEPGEDTEINHGQAALRQLAQDAPLFIAAMHTPSYGYTIEFTSIRSIVPWRILEFLAEHTAHGVLLRSEYGDTEPLLEGA